MGERKRKKENYMNGERGKHRERKEKEREEERGYRKGGNWEILRKGNNKRKIRKKAMK